MAAEEEITLTKILELTKDTSMAMSIFFENAAERMEEVDILISTSDKLIENETSQVKKNELLQYKSMLLQIKSDIENEVKLMKNEQSNISSVSNAVSKAIKWNSGDIF